jgi:hypothetical protein
MVEDWQGRRSKERKKKISKEQKLFRLRGKSLLVEEF